MVAIALKSAEFERARAEVASSAARLFAGFSGEERALACAPMNDARRTAWNYLPGARMGARLDQLDAGSREDVTSFLTAVLSSRGLANVCLIRELEGFLGRAQPDRYQKDGYCIAVFGEPKATPVGDASEPWAVRFEGHHLSLNFTAPAAKFTSTPMFFGSAPFAMPDGVHAQESPLSDERKRGFALLRALTPEQLKVAVIGDATPADIIATAAMSSMAAPRGVAGSSLDEAQRALLLEVIEVFAHRLRGEFAQMEMDRIRKAGIESIHFAWMGALTETRPHYYRIQGPTMIIEFDCTSGTPDHVHTVWRDGERDFSNDVLRDHLEAHDHTAAVAPVPPTAR